MRIAVAPLSNDSDDSSLDAVGRTVTDTIVLTLKLLGSFRVEEPEGLIAIGDIASARDIALSAKLDTLVLGSVTRDETGAFILTVHLYDRQSGAYTINRSAKADTILDVFDAADGLVKGFLETLSGEHIGFGTIELDNAGEQGEYEVRIDGASVGFSLASIPNVLNGRHLVTVVQDRLLGELELARFDGMIVEDGQVPLRFSIPYLTADEKTKLDGLFAAARRGLEDLDGTKYSASVDELRSILDNVPWSPRLADLKPELDRLELFRQVLAIRSAVEAECLSPKAGTIQPLASIVSGLDDISDADGALRDLIIETVNIEAVLLEYEAAKAASEKNWVRVDTAYENLSTILPLASPRVAAFYGDRIGLFSRAVTAYEAGAIPKSKVAPWMIGCGLGLMTTSAVLLVQGADSVLGNEAAQLYESYRTATDSASATSLHTQIVDKINLANLLVSIEVIGLTCGPTMLVIGATAVNNPERAFSKYMKALFKNSIDSRKRFAKLISKRSSGIVFLSADSLSGFKCNGSAIGPSPFSVDPAKNPSIQLSCLGVDASGMVDMTVNRTRTLRYVDHLNSAGWTGMPLNTLTSEPSWLK